jgi:hypothetical protein
MLNLGICCPLPFSIAEIFEITNIAVPKMGDAGWGMMEEKLEM